MTPEPSTQPDRAPRLSIRMLAELSAGIFGVIAFLVVGLLWTTSSTLERVTEEIIADSRRVNMAGELERGLQTYNRISNLELAEPTPELTALRASLEAHLRDLSHALRQEGSEHQRLQRIHEVCQRVEAYLRERQLLHDRGLPLTRVVVNIRPAHEAALGGLHALRLEQEEILQLHHIAADEAARASRYAAAVASGAFLALLVVFGFGVRNHVLRPVVSLYRAIDRYRRGEPDTRAGRQSTTEMDAISRAYDDMLEALATQRRDQVTFLGSVAHELRNPLSTLRSGIEVIRLVGRQTGQAPSEDKLALLERQVDRMRRMLGDFLDTARIEAGELELNPTCFDLAETVREVVKLYQPTTGIHSIEVDLPSSPVVIEADQLRIEQVIGNLISNAVKYSPEGGRIRVAVTVREHDVLLRVSDSGIGIPEPELSGLFAPFHRHSVARNTAPGAGLGLSVARRIVTTHGGEITVESAEGSGSSFTVSLPLPAGSPTAQEESAATTSP